MAQRPTLARVAVVRGELALLVFSDATRDGVIDPAEQRAIGDALRDWLDTDKASHAAQALGDALSRGIVTEWYRADLVERCFTAIDELDELPPLSAA